MKAAHENFRLRPAAIADLPTLMYFAKKAGIGMSTLPADEAVMRAKINTSIKSFAKDITKPKDEVYLFLLEDVCKNTVVGCSSLIAKVGSDAPFYSYKISNYNIVNQDINVNKTVQTLLMVTDKQGTTEVCTLFLLPEYRKVGVGKLLSLGRFLWAADNLQRVSNVFIAEMRGIVSKNGDSPFWHAVGKYFTNLSYQAAEHFIAHGEKQFVSDLMPRYPIYADLLPKSAQHAIGKVRQPTKPALKLLLKEGFQFEHYVDIFDAGPTVEARIENIRTIAQSKVATVSKIVNRLSKPAALVCKTQGEFAGCIGAVQPENKGIKISSKTATLLNIDVGAQVRYVLK